MRKYLFIFLIVLAIFDIYSLGKKEQKNDFQYFPPENTVKIRGTIQIYGNEPHTFIGIVDENGTEYAVYPLSQEEKLRALQGHLVEFTVVLLDEPQGDGRLFLKGRTVTLVKWEIIR